MHGLGDSADGFYPVFSGGDSPMENSTRVRLLTAPEVPVTLNMGMSMNSWFDIISFDWGPNAYNFNDVERNSQRIRSIIDEEIARLGGKSDRIYIGGFSQGCAMALHCGLSYEKP